MALPMYFFYEVGIISAQVFGKKKNQEKEDAPSSSPAAGALAVRRSQPQTQPVGVVAAGDDDYVNVPDSRPQ
jgi:sec-independent protein translocase protein TatC